MLKVLSRIGFVSDRQGGPKKLLKMGNTALLTSSSNYATTPYKCVHRMRLVFLVFLAIFLKHPV